MGTCPVCGHDNAVGSRFCSGCGGALAEVATPGVRKTVTILFCDLVGSTALGERSDPEVLREIMGRYHARCRAILEQFGGSVEKFIGDAAMAVFGVPQVHEDDALRAVRAAGALMEAVEGLGLQVRIGVNTGQVLAGGGETFVTGDAVNVAARLEQHAQAGEVLVGAATAHLVRENVQLEAVEPLQAKGKAEPLPAFRVVGMAADLVGLSHAATPFVGREDDLDGLERLFSTAVDKRAPQVVTIVGPPGIGKSRLVRELLGRLPAKVLVGRCLAYGDALTYGPLADILSSVEDLSAVLAHEDDGDMVAVRIAAATGAAGASASPEEVAWGFRRLLEALARESPVVVVVDDIHWASPILLDLLDYVAAFAQSVPLLLLATARPELFDRRPEWSVPRPHATLLKLEPLPAAQTESLVRQLVDVEPELSVRIVEAADGNPLFVEQLVANHLESGRDELEIPPSLQALLAARVDQLGPGERAVAERASVEGRLFHRAAVTDLLAEAVRADVGTQLLSLVRRELIRPARAVFAGDDAFRFVHVLLRDATYDSMPKRQRADLHERYGNWLLRRLGEDAPPEIVGHHFEQAYRYREELDGSGQDLGERAATQLARAARSAALREETATSVGLLERAVDLAAQAPDLRRQLLLELAQGLTRAGSLERSDAVLREVLSRTDGTGDVRLERLARLELAAVRIFMQPDGAAESARHEAEAAIDTAAPEDHELLARAWQLTAEAHLLAGQGSEQMQAIERATHHARAGGERALEIELVKQSAGVIVFGPVHVDDGLRYVDRLLADMGHVPSIRALALHVRAHLRARLGDFAEANESLSQWRQHLRDLGQELLYATTSACVWDVLALSQDWAGGEEALREGDDILERLGERSVRSTCAAQIGEACYRQGRLEEAFRYSVLSEELGAEDDAMNEAIWRSLRAKVLAGRGEHEEATALARAAVEIADRTDLLDTRAGCYVDLAQVLVETSPEEARRAAAEAAALYRRKGNLVGAALAEQLLS